MDASSPVPSRPSTSGSQPRGRRARGQEALPAAEVQRRNRSLFSANVVSHADQLRLAAKPIGAELTVRAIYAWGSINMSTCEVQ